MTARTLTRIAQALTLFALATPLAHADAPLGAPQRAEVLQKLNEHLQAQYIFPDRVAGLSRALQDKVRAYPAETDAERFSELLSKDLRNLTEDRHFRVIVDPEFRPDPQPAALPSAADLERQQLEVGRMGFGLPTVQRLPGNVAYVELRGFAPPETVGPAYAAAVSLLQGSEALILDLRRNGGGAPDSVALWMSHFFPKGDQRHLNDIVTRSTGKTQQYWTQPGVVQRYDRPVYVLTSPRTFSGGEECAYDFQTQKRATLIGQRTGGGSNPVDQFSLGHDLVISIPVAQAINPVTKTNWEHVGVKPDIEVPAAEALKVAHLAALRAQLEQKDQAPGRAQHLQRLIAQTEKGVVETPVYELRQ